MIWRFLYYWIIDWQKPCAWKAPCHLYGVCPGNPQYGCKGMG